MTKISLSLNYCMQLIHSFANPMYVYDRHNRFLPLILSINYKHEKYFKGQGAINNCSMNWKSY